jgi:1,4-alpha-glucan branching enzyme
MRSHKWNGGFSHVYSRHGPDATRITLEHISNNTPMGANLIANGATFRVWAPGAEKVYVIGDFNA